MEKKTNKGKLEMFKFFENISFIAKLIKLEVIMPYLQILQKYAYQGIFACRIHICDENSSKSYGFVKNAKKKDRKMINFGNFC